MKLKLKRYFSLVSFNLEVDYFYWSCLACSACDLRCVKLAILIICDPLLSFWRSSAAQKNWEHNGSGISKLKWQKNRLSGWVCGKLLPPLLCMHTRFTTTEGVAHNENYIEAYGLFPPCFKYYQLKLQQQWDVFSLPQLCSWHWILMIINSVGKWLKWCQKCREFLQSQVRSDKVIWKESLLLVPFLIVIWGPNYRCGEAQYWLFPLFC